MIVLSIQREMKDSSYYKNAVVLEVISIRSLFLLYILNTVASKFTTGKKIAAKVGLPKASSTITNSIQRNPSCHVSQFQVNQ